jgi:hypothetical protein
MREPVLVVNVVRPTGKQLREMIDGLDLVFELAARRHRRRGGSEEGLDLCRE